jgi:uncharacterized protein with PhoU and TrkA domain
MRYRPSNVKDTIVQIRDVNELMLDFAYSSILFSEEHFGEEVLELMKTMEELIFSGRVAVMLSARGMEETKSLTGVLQFFDSSMQIGTVAVDLAKIELADIGLPRAFIQTLHFVEETLTGVIVPSDSKAVSTNVDDIEKNTGMRLIAIKKRSGQWIFDPSDTIVIKDNDKLFAKGPFEALSNFEIFITGHSDVFPNLSEIREEQKELREIRETLIEMMSLSQLSVDLAFSSVIFNSQDIAEEVSRIEDKLELLRSDLETKVLLYGKKVEDIKPLRGLIRLAYTSEKLSDASKAISDLVSQGIGTHPVLLYAMKKADEIITRLQVGRGSIIDGKSISEANLEADMGIDIIAVYKENQGRWIYNPKGDVIFEPNDTLIAKGDSESERRLAQVVYSSQPEAESRSLPSSSLLSM